MQQRIRILMATALIGATVACGDGTAPAPVATPTLELPSQTLASAQRQKSERVTPAEFHARNKMDWVGVEHNRLMDELRADIRLRRPKDLCKAIERLGVESMFDRRATDRISAADARKVRRAAFDATGCKGQRFGTRHASNTESENIGAGSVVNASYVTNDFEMSPAGWAIIDRITSAGGDAPDPGALASELAAIVADAQALTPDEQNVVDAAASVALSSYEYWSQNAEGMAQEMSTAYGHCVENGGGDSCFYVVSGRSQPRANPLLVHLAANTRSTGSCTIDRGFIWSGDKWGVGVGIAAGLMSRRVEGVIIGILAGAAAGSGGAATWEFGRYVWCAYHT